MNHETKLSCGTSINIESLSESKGFVVSISEQCSKDALHKAWVSHYDVDTGVYTLKFFITAGVMVEILQTIDKWFPRLVSPAEKLGNFIYGIFKS